MSEPVVDILLVGFGAVGVVYAYMLEKVRRPGRCSRTNRRAKACSDMNRPLKADRARPFMYPWAVDSRVDQGVPADIFNLWETVPFSSTV